MSERISALSAFQRLLGRHKIGRPEQLSLLCQIALNRIDAGDFGQPEVEDFDNRSLILVTENQIAGFDVPVNHPAFVGVLKSLRGLIDEVAGVGHRQNAALPNELRKIASFDVFHGKSEAVAQGQPPNKP